MVRLSDKINPTEEQEQMAFVQWLQINNISHFRVPNETYTKSWKQKIKNKALGVSSGVPDLFVVLETGGKDWINSEVGDSRLVAIEMKRKKGGVVTENQKRWLKILNDAGVEAVVCKGYQEAVKFVMDRMPQKEFINNLV